MLKFITGLTTGALLTLTGLAAAATFRGRETCSGIDVLEDESLEAAERLREKIEELEKEQKAQLNALCEDLRERREALNATAMAKEPVSEPPTEPAASDSPVENAES